MTKELKPIDISTNPDLVRLAEEVRSSREPRVLRREGEDLAILMPLETTTQTAAGSPWLKELYELFAPVRQEILDKGISEDEVNADIDAAVAEVRAARKPHG